MNVGEKKSWYVEVSRSWEDIHETHIHFFVCPFVPQIDFAKPSFLAYISLVPRSSKAETRLTWCSEQNHLPIDAKLFHCQFRSTSDGHSSNTNEVVPTCMTDPRKSIHFWVYAKDGAALLMRICCDPRCFQQVVLLDDKPLFFHECCVHIVSISIPMLVRSMPIDTHDTNFSSNFSSGCSVTAYMN